MFISTLSIVIYVLRTNKTVSKKTVKSYGQIKQFLKKTVQLYSWRNPIVRQRYL